MAVSVLQEELGVQIRAKWLVCASILVLSGCEILPKQMAQVEPVDTVREAAPVTDPELAAPPPPPAARTVEQFDTTTEEQRVAAAAPSAGGRLLGQTVASLGDPGRPGFWAETDLVDAVTPGRLVFPVNGNSVEVELSPSSGGSRVSLAAMRVLEAPLTGLPILEVYAR